MGDHWKARVDRIVDAKDGKNVQQAYDDWAPSYDADHASFGGPLLTHFVGMFCRHVTHDVTPILDAGAGTGRMGETLTRHGYGGFVAVDLSPGMLDVARTKPGYTATHQMRLGDRLGFDDETFAVTASLASFAPGHAGHEAFGELIRVTKRGGLLVLALRAGCEAETRFDKKRAEFERAGHWELLDEVSDFVSHPDVDPPLRYGVHVYQRC
ncbi:MAG: class I SAM-dependent methyltransferase [Silicimonas sp.]|nr:class I SAM-dependent methyltransferase [Silicimonas sp.]